MGGWVGGWFGGWVVWWVGGWIIWKYNQLSPQLGRVGAWAELGNLALYIGHWRSGFGIGT